MADRKVAEAYVEIGAKMDKLDRDLKKTEKKVEDGFDKAGKKAGNALESPIVSAALKATASFGALELGVGAVNVAVDAMTGDIEDAAEAVKRLPAGIGPFAAQLETLLGNVTGLRQATEAWAKATESGLQVLSAQMSNAERMIANARDVYDQEINVLKEIEQIRLKGIDDEDAKLMRLEANFAASKRVLDIERQIENLRQANARQSAETGQAATERSDRIAEIKKELEGIDRAFRQNPLLEIEFLSGPKQERASALQVELSNLQKLSDLRNDELQGRIKKIEQLETLIQKVNELNALEDKQVTENIKRLEQEKIDENIQRRSDAQNAVQEAMNKAREDALRMEEQMARQQAREREQAAREEEQRQRQQRRDQQEAVRLQRQIDSTGAQVRSVSDRDLNVGDIGFGSKAGTAENLRPQKIESKTLDEIKALLERNLALATGGFA